ncbi:MAG: inositol monophosphatase family protein [Myxococcota bacterium]
MSLCEALQVAVEAARDAGEILRPGFHHPEGPPGTRQKSPLDVQAEGLVRDRLEAAFPDHGVRGEELRHRDRRPSASPRMAWVIDPQDGTAACWDGVRGSAVSIGLLRDGVPVLGVVYAYAAPDDDGDLVAWAEGCGPLTRNGVPVEPPPPAERLSAEHTVLVSHMADRLPRANAEATWPARFRTTPSIAWRLALVAVGDAEAASSLGSPMDWDVVGGHALLRASRRVLVDVHGRAVTHSSEEDVHVGDCFAAGPEVARALAARSWDAVKRRGRREFLRWDLLPPAQGPTVADPGLLSRAQGALLGQVAGDDLGSLVEFQSARAIAAVAPDGVRRLRDGGVWDTLAGQPTDDSELALLLARGLVEEGGFDAEAILGAYAWWYDSGPFDVGATIGDALRAASEAIRQGTSPLAAVADRANPDSQANGALMRVSPLGVLGHDADPDEVAAWARDDAALTHPHPVCRDASAAFAIAVAHAVAGGDGPADVYEFTRREAARLDLHPDVRVSLDAAADGPPDDFSRQMGWVRIALRNAFFRLLDADGPEDGVVATVMAGGDTDTNAAIAGALLGAVHGRAALPLQWRDRVLTCRSIEGLRGVRRPRPGAFWPVDVMRLAERLLVARRAEGFLSPKRPAR